LALDEGNGGAKKLPRSKTMKKKKLEEVGRNNEGKSPLTQKKTKSIDGVEKSILQKK